MKKLHKTCDIFGECSDSCGKIKKFILKPPENFVSWLESSRMILNFFLSLQLFKKHQQTSLSTIKYDKTTFNSYKNSQISVENLSLFSRENTSNFQLVSLPLVPPKLVLKKLVSIWCIYTNTDQSFKIIKQESAAVVFDQLV